MELLTVCLMAIMLLCGASSCLAEAPVPAAEIALSTGVVYIPDAYQPDDGRIDMVVHFHGAPEHVRDRFFESGRSAVLVAVSFKGLSEAYGKPFRGTDLFRRVLGEATRRTADHFGLKRVKVRRLVLSSFSAGYGAIREILKLPGYQALISDVVLADSLYAGYVQVGGRNAVDPEDMASFVPFARRAAEGKATMFITYSGVIPPNYASTEETADYLIRQVGAKKVKASGESPPGMKLTAKADLGGFHVWGYAGDTGPDHMKHLHALGAWLRHTSLKEAEK